MNIQSIVGFKAYGKLRNVYRKVHGSNIYEIRKDEVVKHNPIFSQIRSREEFETKYGMMADELRIVLNPKGVDNSSRKNYEGLIMPGKCDFCGCTAGFSVPVGLNGIKSYRETSGCTGCAQVARVRIILAKCRELCKDGKKDVYMYENGGG